MTEGDTSTLGIEVLGAPVLRRETDEIEEIDAELRELVARMFATMYENNGQGLAAPQVGISKRLAVVDVPPRPGETYVLVNPRIVSTGEARSRGTEGCLSIPGVSEVVERSAEVVVVAQDLNGEPLRIAADGELARCFQHEIDHLDGVLYIDRLSPLTRKLLLSRYRKRQ